MAETAGRAPVDLADAAQDAGQAASQGIAVAARGIGVLLVGQILMLGERVIFSVVLVRALGSDSYGLYALAITTAQVLASAAQLGLGVGLVRFVSVFAGRRDQPGIWASIQVGVGVPTVLGVVFGACLAVFATPLSELVFHDGRLAPLLRLLGLGIPFLVLADVVSAATRGLKQMHYTVIANFICHPTVKLLALVAFILVGLDAFRATIAFVLAEVAAAVLLVYFLSRRFSLRRPLGGARRTLREMLGYSVPLQMSQMVDQYSQSAQVLLLGALQATSTVGIYSVSSQINQVGRTVQTVVYTAASPLIAELYDQRKRARLGHLYQTASKWSFSFSLPWFLVLVLVPEQILSLFGESFAGGANALRILAFATLVNTSTGICGGMLDMTGHSRLRLVNSVISALAMLGLSVALIPSMGVLGAACGFVAGTAVVNLIRLIQVHYLLGLLPYSRDYLKPISACIAGLAAALLVGRLLEQQAAIAQGLVQVAVLALVYAAAILALGLTPEDRLLLDPLLRRARIR